MKIIYTSLLVFILSFLLVGCNTTKNNDLIQTYTRDTTSGTRDAFFSSINFKEAIKDDSVLPKSSLIVDGNGDMITKVVNDSNSIGYISLSSYKEDKVKGLSIDGVIPSDDNVLNGTYQLKRGFYYIITKNNQSDSDLLAIAFNSYLTTKDAMLIIKSKGGIVPLDESLPTWDSIKANHPITLKDNSKTIVRFGGSTSVEPIAKALSIDFSIKSGNFKPEHNYTGSSAAFKGTQGSDYNTNSLLHIAFSSRSFNDNEVAIENTSGLLSYDAIVTIVSKNNKLEDITLIDLKKVYDNTYTSYNEVQNGN